MTDVSCFIPDFIREKGKKGKNISSFLSHLQATGMKMWNLFFFNNRNIRKTTHSDNAVFPHEACKANFKLH